MRANRKKWVRPLAEMPLWQAVNWIESAPQRQLKAAIRAMESCTSTNCWWGEYQTAQIMLPRARKFLRPNTQIQRAP